MLGEIQTKIIRRVLNSEGLRYSEAYPGEEIGDDLYNYHLQQLVKNGLLSKNESRYQLTQEGKIEAQMIDAKGEYQEKFRVSVLLYVINREDKVLMCQRTRWPLRGDVVCPSGKVKRGELITGAAKRKLKEETDLEADFELGGVLRSIRRVGPELVEDTIYHVCVTHNPGGELKQKSDFGEFEWMSWDQAAVVAKKNKGNSRAQQEIMEKVRAGDTEMKYWEEELELESY